MQPKFLVGLVFALASSFAFALPGPVGKALYASGWSPGSVTLVRLTGCALVLLIPTLIQLRGKWGEVRAHWRLIVAFGLFSMTGVQATYFVAVERLNVTVAILLEMTAPMMIVFWLWARTKARPSGLTFFGLAISMIGLVAVLDVGAVIREGSDALDALGVIMGLASAVCLAVYFLISANDSVKIPSTALTGLGFAVGAIGTVPFVVLGLLPWKATTDAAALGQWNAPWFLAHAIIIVFTVAAYVLGVVGLRLMGAGVGSFVNLTEVLFAALVAWWLLGETLAVIQFVGGAAILAGVVFIKLGERPRGPSALAKKMPGIEPRRRVKWRPKLKKPRKKTTKAQTTKTQTTGADPRKTTQAGRDVKTKRPPRREVTPR